MDREERLKLALRTEAERIRVSPALKERLDARLGRRWVRPVVLAAATAVLVAVAALALVDRDVAEDVIAPPVEEEYFPAFWPVTTEGEAREIQAQLEQGRMGWHRFPDFVANDFATQFLGWPAERMVRPAEVRAIEGSSATGWSARVEVRQLIGEDDVLVEGPLHVVDLVGLPGTEEPAWFVAGIRSPNLEVDEPDPGTPVSSPLHVSGRGRAYEANVVSEIRDDVGNVLHRGPGEGQGSVGGADSMELAPMSGDLEFDPPSAPAGILILAGDTGLDGPLPDHTIVRIRFADPLREPGDAHVALRCFLEARLRVDLDLARPCMSERFAKTVAGPEADLYWRDDIVRFTITQDVRCCEPPEVTIAVETILGTSEDAISAFASDIFGLVFDGGRWLVDSWSPEHPVPHDPVLVVDTAPVRVHLLGAGDSDPCWGPDQPSTRAEVPSDVFVDVERRVPILYDPIPLRAARELLMGPTPWEEATGLFPPAARVRSVEVSGGVAQVDLNHAAVGDLTACRWAVRSIALERTLTALPGIDSVRVTVEGEEVVL